MLSSLPPFPGLCLDLLGSLVLVLFLCPRNCVSSLESVPNDTSKYVKGACCLSVRMGSSTNISLADFRDFQWLKLATGTLVNYNMNSHGRTLQEKYQCLERSVVIPKAWEEVSGEEVDQTALRGLIAFYSLAVTFSSSPFPCPHWRMHLSLDGCPPKFIFSVCSWIVSL